MAGALPALLAQIRLGVHCGCERWESLRAAIWKFWRVQSFAPEVSPWGKAAKLRTFAWTQRPLYRSPFACDKIVGYTLSCCTYPQFPCLVSHVLEISLSMKFVILSSYGIPRPETDTSHEILTRKYSSMNVNVWISTPRLPLRKAVDSKSRHRFQTTHAIAVDYADLD